MAKTLPLHKTKIVCTIGPACRSLPVLEGMIKSGMDIARLNFAHGTVEDQAKDIRDVRAVAARLGRTVSILADLPGAKIRIGKLNGPVVLKKGDKVTLTTKTRSHTGTVIPVEYKKLPDSVSKGGVVYINDGFIQLKVERVYGKDVFCKVLIGGKLLSHKGINLPGSKMFVDPITQADFALIDFGLRAGVTTFGLSFVETAADIIKVREYVKKKGKSVYLVAKIERREAIENFDEILNVADAVMMARGDLGVEIPIEEVPLVQKKLIQKANAMGRPVITATQMLESMTQNVRPTRAEVNDVANAILDGTDAVMLSEETAIGEYPVETVRMMAKIAAFTESQRDSGALSDDEGRQIRNIVAQGGLTMTDSISLNAVKAAKELKARYILTPTSSGSTARRISRFKPPCWTLALGTQKHVCEFLLFSYGVYPFFMSKEYNHSPEAILKILKSWRLIKKDDTIIVTERRLSRHSGETDSLTVVVVGK